ncbi:hypothetical protein, conserved [Plasmodium gonderi]|uniref:C3H1-type domain-containing protein n=1 Tax=Plasmodium gonderi TaxID=77519 RepID=A0A1Y1JID7_PLAGO|nr:hypothetical protein, conserved [Plasmodium gonderi]GAW82000.1 hypothetical protein, conserved [Plasmodium gonderi]
MSIGVPVTKSFNKLKKYPFEINKFDRRETNEYFYLPVDCPRMKKCDDAYCPLAHTKLEKIFHPIVYKTQACQMAKDGACDYFQKCAFYHDSNDKNEAHLNWTIWEKKWDKWRNNIDTILTQHNKNDKEIRRKVESILKIRMPHVNYNSNKNNLFLNKNISFHSTWPNFSAPTCNSSVCSGQNTGLSSGSLGSNNKMNNLNNLLCNSMSASITHCPTTIFNNAWNSKPMNSGKKGLKIGSDNKKNNNNCSSRNINSNSISNNNDNINISNNNSSNTSSWINELNDLGTLNYDKTVHVNTNFMNKNNAYYDETLSYNSNATECGMNFDMLDNNAYKVVEFCFTDYENNRNKSGWSDNSDILNIQSINSFLSHGSKVQDEDMKSSLNISSNKDVEMGGCIMNPFMEGGTRDIICSNTKCTESFDDSQLENPFLQELLYNRTCEYFPTMTDIPNREDTSNLCKKANTLPADIKDDMIIRDTRNRADSTFDLMSSKYFSNNSNNTSIFENYANLSTIFDVSDSNNNSNNDSSNNANGNNANGNNANGNNDNRNSDNRNSDNNNSKSKNNNNKLSNFSSISNCNTFDHLSFDDIDKKGVTVTVTDFLIPNENVEERNDSKVNNEHADVGSSVIQFAHDECSVDVKVVNEVSSESIAHDVAISNQMNEKNEKHEIKGVNETNIMKDEKESKPHDVTNIGNSTTLGVNPKKGANKTSKKNKNKKSGANSAANSGSNSYATMAIANSNSGNNHTVVGCNNNAVSGCNNQRTSTFSEILCSGNVELKNEVNEKKKNSKKENKMNKNCNNEKEQDDNKNGNNKIFSSTDKNDENLKCIENACVEKEKREKKNTKGKNTESQGTKKGNNTSNTNKNGSKNSKRNSAESGNNGGESKNKKYSESDNFERGYHENEQKNKTKSENSQSGKKHSDVGVHSVQNDNIVKEEDSRNGKEESKSGSGGTGTGSGSAIGNCNGGKEKISLNQNTSQVSKSVNANEKNKNSPMSARDIVIKGNQNCSVKNSTNHVKGSNNDGRNGSCSSSGPNKVFSWTNIKNDKEKEKKNNEDITFNSVNNKHNKSNNSSIHRVVTSNKINITRKSTTESSLNNEQHMDDMKEVENNNNLEQINYTNCEENNTQEKESNEYNISNKEFIQPKDNIFCNYTRNSMDSVINNFMNPDNKSVSFENVSNKGGNIIFDKKSNTSKLISKEGINSSTSMQGMVQEMHNKLKSSENINEDRNENRNENSIFNTNKENSFIERNVSNNTYENFFLRDVSFNPLKSNSFVESSKSFEYNPYENETNESLDYTNNLLNIFLSCNSINENFEPTNDYAKEHLNEYKDNMNPINNMEQSMTNIYDLFNSSSNNFNPFGNYNFLGPSCLQCKHYKNEIKNLLVQIRILREELFKYKQIIIGSGINENNKNKINSYSYNWTSTKGCSGIYENKNLVSSIEAND